MSQTDDRQCAKGASDSTVGQKLEVAVVLNVLFRLTCDLIVLHG